jgi:NAD(P)-dependent dehydrogenase (short-subunit alcohol dehydrogenase family)
MELTADPERMTAHIPSLTGRTIVVTGANSGLGYEATRIFAEKDASVVMACRDTDRGREAAERISRTIPGAALEVLELDLADLDSVRAFVARFEADYEDLHVLCNNAGVMAIPRRETADGFETQFGVNHLGHFALTGLLCETLAGTDDETRVITQSSAAHENGEIDFEDLQGERSYSKWGAYGQSKLANVLFAYELDRRLSAAGLDVKSVACHPGYAATELQTTGPAMEGSLLKQWTMAGANRLVAQSAAMGALPMLYAGTASTIEGGEYIGPDGPFGARGYPTRAESSARSHDRVAAERLWEVSTELTGVEFDLDRAEAGPTAR